MRIPVSGASRWVSTWYALADFPNPFYGQPLSRPNPEAGHKRDTYKVGPQFKALIKGVVIRSWRFQDFRFQFRYCYLTHVLVDSDTIPIARDVHHSIPIPVLTIFVDSKPIPILISIMEENQQKNVLREYHSLFGGWTFTRSSYVTHWFWILDMYQMQITKLLRICLQVLRVIIWPHNPILYLKMDFWCCLTTNDTSSIKQKKGGQVTEAILHLWKTMIFV